MRIGDHVAQDAKKTIATKEGSPKWQQILHLKVAAEN
jgi:hypothetical protein